MLFLLLACTPGTVALGSSPFTTRDADVRTDDTAVDDTDTTLAYEGDAPGECADGADNDRNGYFDCLDTGCARSPDCAPADTDADTDSDTDADTDSDTDADTDSDTDADTDSDTAVDPSCTGITVDPLAISIPASRGAYEARVRIIGCATGLTATAESVVLSDGRSWETSWTSVPTEVDGEVTLSLLYYGTYDETTLTLTATFASDQGDDDTFVLMLY